MNNINILDYFMATNHEFLHPKGETGTNFLLNKLNLEKEDKVLEIGFGTGATLVKIISLPLEIELNGIEMNQQMIDKTKSRLKFCNALNKVKIKQLTSNDRLPYESNYFDKIFAESVIGIQKGEDFKDLIIEINRILKPGGSFIINDLIWSIDSDQTQIDRTNNFVSKRFGIIQSNGKYNSLDQWVQLFEDNNFVIEDIFNISDQVKHKFRWPSNKIERLSYLFSLKGKYKKWTSAILRKKWKYINEEMNQYDGIKKLDPFIIVIKKSLN